ncbi:PREDICTED: uncharacterized protein LOC108553079 isoform X2 [Eufriesea mexicana]|nr:PREDICTED: uncharacterized protein LOC108553079 isoform X2 [Eufriesea mexicana]
MIGIKDPTEPPKLEQLKQGHEQMNYAMKSVTIQNLDLANIQMHFFEFSKGMADKFRSILDNLKAHIQRFYEQNQPIFDLFSLPQLQEWSERKK